MIEPDAVFRFSALQPGRVDVSRDVVPELEPIGPRVFSVAIQPGRVGKPCLASVLGPVEIQHLRNLSMFLPSHVHMPRWISEYYRERRASLGRPIHGESKVLRKPGDPVVQRSVEIEIGAVKSSILPDDIDPARPIERNLGIVRGLTLGRMGAQARRLLQPGLPAIEGPVEEDEGSFPWRKFLPGQVEPPAAVGCQGGPCDLWKTGRQPSRPGIAEFCVALMLAKSDRRSAPGIAAGGRAVEKESLGSLGRLLHPE